jgi:hypothetical protein
MKCTCHPSEAPQPCQHKYAFSECVVAAKLATPQGPSPLTTAFLSLTPFELIFLYMSGAMCFASLAWWVFTL